MSRMATWALATATLFLASCASACHRTVYLQSGPKSTSGGGHFWTDIPDSTNRTHAGHLRSRTRHVFLVQIDQALRANFSAIADDLRDGHRIQILNYYPDNAFLVYARYRDLLVAVQGSPGIVWSSFMLPQDKVAEDLWRNGTMGQLKPGDAIAVSLADDDSEDDAWPDGDRTISGNRIVYVIGNDTDADALLTQLAVNPKVLFIQRMSRMRPMNNWATTVGTTGQENGKRELSATLNALQGDNQVIAITDTGINWHHCLFAEADSGDVKPPPFLPWTKNGGALATLDDDARSRRKIVQYVTYAGSTNDSNPSLSGHGTHVSATAAGSPASGHAHGDYVSHRGMAPNAKIAFFGIGTVSAGLSVPTDLNTGLFPYGYAAGARVSCNAWGDPNNNGYDTYAHDVDTFTYAHKDFLPAFAAGNFGWCGQPSSLTSPATSKNALAVGSSGQPQASLSGSLFGFGSTMVPAEVAAVGASHYGIDDIPSYSSVGPTLDGRIKPDILTPGFTVTSACGNPSSPHCGDSPGDCLCQAMGTSTSVPSLTGGLALIRQYLVEGYHPTGYQVAGNGFTPSAALLKALVINGAVHLGGQRLISTDYRTEVEQEKAASCPGTSWKDVGGSVPNFDQGFGRFQLTRSVFVQDYSMGYIQFIPGKEFASADDFHDRTIAAGESHSYQFCAWPGSVQVRVTLVWTDPPPAAGATVQLVNDLDLAVHAGGHPLLGNGGSAPDRLNNVEAVYLNTDPSSKVDFNVTVTGYKVPVGNSQPYALVVAGKIATGNCTTAVLPDYYRDPIVISQFWTPLTIAMAAGLALITTILVCCLGRCLVRRLRTRQERRADSVPVGHAANNNDNGKLASKPDVGNADARRGPDVDHAANLA
ncbi:unnamed protein product (mitochondrion) [Plasmodiophora brassicae]|uniref:subtilisin n=1 Tax=Plasmodiophora brassicae TaxID=37360 RepID=A0A3P3Y5T0_PLABS|nr:unnamed protein product [Plasmodiophora brassicae]